MSSAEWSEDRARMMRLATYVVACLAMLAWAVPIAVIANAVMAVYERFFGSLTTAITTLVPPFAPIIGLSIIGCLFSLLAPVWLRSRGHDNWALGMAFLSLGAGLVLAVPQILLPLVR
jgi:hypothetical protein